VTEALVFEGETGARNSLTAKLSNLQLKGRIMFEGLMKPTHLLVIPGTATLEFGPKKLPALGKGIGEGIRGFKPALKEQ